MEYPENCVWYLEAFPVADSATDRDGGTFGSAVAVWLRKTGETTGKRYLLTCSHVVRGRSKDGKTGFGTFRKDLRAWEPGKGYAKTPQPIDRAQSRPIDGAQRVKVIAPAPEEGDVPASERYGANDWVVLEFEDSELAATASTVMQWKAAERVGLQIVGYPSGAETWRTGTVVSPTSSRDFRLRDINSGIVVLRGPDDARPGMSGGGIFNSDGSFAGLHRSNIDAALQNRGVSAEHIRDQLKALSYEILDRSEGNDNLCKRITEAYPHVKKLPDATKYAKGSTATSSSTRPDMAFDIRVRLCDTFAQALDAHRTHLSDEEVIDTNPSPQMGGSQGDVPHLDLNPEELATLLKLGNDDRGNNLTALLIHAPGGSGKSSFLHRLMRASQSVGLVPFFIDFAQAPLPDDQIAEDSLETWWKAVETTGQIDKMIALSEATNNPFKPLLIVDGLNQSSLSWENVLRHLNRRAKRDLAGTAIVVADRLTDHDMFSLDAFKLAVVPPLTKEAYSKALLNRPAHRLIEDDAWHSLLSSPLFLQLLSEISTDTAIGVPSRFHVLRRYFEVECKLDRAEMECLGAVAYEMYREFRKTAFSKSRFDQLLQDDFFRRNESADRSRSSLRRLGKKMKMLRKKIKDFDIVSTFGSTAEYRHQILHDFFCALRIVSSTAAEEEQILRAPSFDVVSLRGSSSDAIELVVEALQEPDPLTFRQTTPLTARAFLTEVYDWNYWITLQGVMSFDRRSALKKPIDDWMRHAFYALNLEKQFDPFLHTMARAKRLQKYVIGSPDVEYASAANPAQLREGVGRAVRAAIQKLDPNSSSFRDANSWLSIYTRMAEVDRDALRALWRDPLLSWTAANAFCRVGLSADIAEEIMRLYEVSAATSDSSPRAAGFRWRLVHALGRAPAEPAGNFLLQVAISPRESHHVRYGAVRSLVEVAAAAISGGLSANGQELLEKLRDNLEHFRNVGDGRDLDNVRLEMRRVCALNEEHIPHLNWGAWCTIGLAVYRRILERGKTIAKDKKEADEWELWRKTLDDVVNTAECENRKAKWLEIINQ